jgi:hypothetical protein
MRKDVVYLGMIWCNDIIGLNTNDEGYSNGKKYGKKGAISGPNTYQDDHDSSPYQGTHTTHFYRELLPPRIEVNKFDGLDPTGWVT